MVVHLEGVIAMVPLFSFFRPSSYQIMDRVDDAVAVVAHLLFLS